MRKTTEKTRVAAARKKKRGKETFPPPPPSLPFPHNQLTEPLLVARFGHPAIEPVHDVEAAIGAQQEDVVSGEVVDVSRALQQDELREDRHRLEQDRKGPGRLHGAGAVRGQPEGQERGRRDEEGDAEGVVRRVVRLSDALCASHQVEDGG